MKKSMILTMLLMLCSMGAFAQNKATADAASDSVKIFLGNFTKFVSQIEVNDSTTEEEYEELDLRYKNFNKLYTGKFKKQMTNEQMSTFTKYKTRYKMKVLDHKLDKKTGRLSQKADTIGHKMGEGLKKAGSEIGGFVKGLFSKD